MKNNITQNIKNKSWKVILPWMLVILSVIGVFSAIGNYICLPWELSFTPQNVVSQDINNGRGAIIDNSTHRVLFIDNNNTVVNVIENTNASSNPVFYKWALTDNDGSVYIYSYSCFKNSTYLQNESITKYTNNGANSQLIKSFDYDLDNNRTQSSRIRNFAIVGDNLSLSIYDAINNFFSWDLCSKNEYSGPDTVKTIYQVPNDIVYEACIYIDSVQNYYVFDLNDSVYCYDIATSTFGPTDTEAFWQLYSKTFVNNQTARSFSPEDIIKGYNQQETSNLMFSALIIARVMLFWVSLVVLVVVAIVLLVRFAIKLIKEQKFSFDKYKIPVILIASFAFAVCVTWFYCVNSINNTNESNKKQLVVSSKILSEDYSGLLDQILTEYRATGMIPLDKYSTFVRAYEKAVLYSAWSEVYNQFELDININGQVLDLFSTAFPTLQNNLIEIDNLEYKDSQYSNGFGFYIWQSSTYNGNFINCTSLIKDADNNILGAATAKTEAFVFKASYITDIVLMILALVMAVISISFVFYELRNFVQSFIEKRRIAQTDKKLSEVSLARPVRLLCMMSQCAECTLATVIVKGMLVGTALEGNAIVMTLPSIASTLGCFIMTLVYAPLVARFGIKRLSIVSCVLAVLSYVLCVGAVVQSAVFLLSVGILIANFFKEVLYLYTSALPMCCKDEKMRSNTNTGLSTCSISASAIMGVLVGWTVDGIGSYTAYVIAAIPVAIQLIVVMLYIPKRSLTDSSYGKLNNSNKGSGLLKDAITLLTNRRIIVYILGPLMIAIICSCYRNLVFPLMADDLGLSSSAISNILVLSNALVYYLTMNSSKFISSFNTGKLLILCQVLIGVFYLMFLVNSSLMWVIVMLMFSQYFQKLITSTGNTYYQGIALDLKLGANNTIVSMSQIGSICNLVANGFLGSVITAIGAVGACVVSGIYGLVSGGTIFIDYVSNRNKKLRKVDNDQK